MPNPATVLNALVSEVGCEMPAEEEGVPVPEAPNPEGKAEPAAEGAGSTDKMPECDPAQGDDVLLDADTLEAVHPGDDIDSEDWGPDADSPTPSLSPELSTENRLMVSAPALCPLPSAISSIK